MYSNLSFAEFSCHNIDDFKKKLVEEYHFNFASNKFEWGTCANNQMCKNELISRFSEELAKTKFEIRQANRQCDQELHNLSQEFVNAAVEASGISAGIFALFCLGGVVTVDAVYMPGAVVLIANFMRYYSDYPKIENLKRKKIAYQDLDEMCEDVRHKFYDACLKNS